VRLGQHSPGGRAMELHILAQTSSEFFNEFLKWKVWDVPVWRMTGFTLVLILGLFLKNYLLERILSRFDVILQKTKTDVDNLLVEAVRQPLSWVVFIFVVYLATTLLKLPKEIRETTTVVLQSLGTIFVAWMLYRAIEILGLFLTQLTERTESEMDNQLVPLVRRVLGVLLISLTIITVIQQWGYDVTSLVAGLGIGGIALALGAQETLSNWFGSIMIFTDRPFLPGDWVKSKYGEGIVEEVGMRSTKIRTFEKTLITVPNSEVAASAVENVSSRNMRRFKKTFGLLCSTSAGQMEQVITGFRTFLEEHELIDETTVLVYFEDMGDFTLDVFVHCFVKTTDYPVYLRVKQEIFLEFMRIAADAGTDFAFPTQTVQVENIASPN
jgi:MscS family membrane protein